LWDEVKVLAIKQIKLDVNEVTVGMFISGLDRPWTQTPFPLQGFYVRDMEEIAELKAHCRHVYIDVIKGNSPLKPTRLKTLSNGPTASIRDSRTPSSTRLTDLAPIKVRENVYAAPTVPIEKEIDKARVLHLEVYGAVSNVMEQLEKDHNSVPLNETKRAASAMVDSILRSPDAFTWLSRVREKDEYTYSHAVRCAVWSILFGRHLGLNKLDLDVLAMGLLLKDIGKTRLPRHLLENAERTTTEQEAFEKFVDYGVEILRKVPDIKPRVTSVVKTHCERINGSGFPEHLRGDRIPLLGKIAGVVTFYDEITNPRGQAHPLSPSKAVARLYELRDVEFQSDLVVEFIRAIGLYPTGTLVELNTGEVAVVVEQNFKRRLKPRVMIVTDAYKRLLVEPVFLDMAEDELEKQAKIDAGKLHPSEVERIEIVQDLEPGTYDVDVAAVRDQYLMARSGNKLLSFLKNRSRISSLFGG
jgi:HD-GYP domain-containing protein (c-di-GMP phosphodiesterase class II)